MRLSWHHLESLQTTLGPLRLELNRPLAVSMCAMTMKRRQRRSVARVTVCMKTSDACVKIHSAGQTRIGSIERWAVPLGSMRESPNQEARLLSEQTQRNE